MYADIKTCLGTIWKKHTFLTRKGKYNIGLFSVMTFFLKSYSQKQFLTRIFADIGRNLPT